MQNEPPIYALERPRGAPSTHCEVRLPRRGIAHSHHHRDLTDSVRLLPHQSGQKQPQKSLLPPTHLRAIEPGQCNSKTDAQVVRISMDANAAVKVGDFSRGGKKRVRIKAADHDFTAMAKVTPVGILVPQSDELFLCCVTSKVTSDCLEAVREGQGSQLERMRLPGEMWYNRSR
jgi:Rhodopirellula transposase DDE domain